MSFEKRHPGLKGKYAFVTGKGALITVETNNVTIDGNKEEYYFCRKEIDASQLDKEVVKKAIEEAPIHHASKTQLLKRLNL